MTAKIPDLERLARGELHLVAEGHAGYQSTLDSFSRFGTELADESTWRHWCRFHQVELWQAVALQLHMDPDKGPWDRLNVLGERHLSTPQHLFSDHMRQALLHIERGSLSIVEAGKLPRRAKVRLWEFAAWCDEIGLPCPAQMPRHDPKPMKALAEPEARRAPAAPSDFLRAADLVPDLVPFSKSTLWRLAKIGKFPKPINLSAGVTAWRRSDYEKWKVEKLPEFLARKKGKRA